ncbi:MAG: MerR family DNA-binding protein [Acidimicrobiales bacterium]
MRTGELAERAGITPEAVRFYQRVGVLSAPARTASGYRGYDEVAVDRLSFVRAAQAVGLTLGQIRELIAFRDQDEPPCALVLELIQRRSTELGGRIAELKRIKAELDHLAERVRSLRPEDCLRPRSAT